MIFILFQVFKRTKFNIILKKSEFALKMLTRFHKITNFLNHKLQLTI